MLPALHADVQSTYRPVTPELDLGGALNRYTTARHAMFTQVERLVTEGGGAAGVETLYTGRFLETGPDEEPDDDDVNAEHVWPRFRMAEDEEGARFRHEESDVHNLFPADSGANSARGSLRFGEPVSDIDETWSPSRIGLDAAGERVFEPRAARRGDVARAVLYFSVRWGRAVRDDEEAVLRRWAGDDPVAERERARNDAVARVQGNRNPFVDCPGLVMRVPDFADFPIADRDLPLP